MRIARLYQDGHEIYGSEYDITRADTDHPYEGRIAGTAGWVDAYIIKTKPRFAGDGLMQLVARVPAWMVIAEYEVKKS